MLQELFAGYYRTIKPLLFLVSVSSLLFQGHCMMKDQFCFPSVCQNPRNGESKVGKCCMSFGAESSYSSFCKRDAFKAWCQARISLRDCFCINISECSWHSWKAFPVGKFFKQAIAWGIHHKGVLWAGQNLTQSFLICLSVLSWGLTGRFYYVNHLTAKHQIDETGKLNRQGCYLTLRAW